MCVSTHKVEQQRKNKPFKHEVTKPLTQNQCFNRGSSNRLPKLINPSPSTPQKFQTPQRTFSPQNYQTLVLRALDDVSSVKDLAILLWIDQTK